MNIKDAKQLIKSLYHLQVETGVRYSVELVSGPGLGKSQMAAQVAKELGKELECDFGFKPFFLSTVEQPDVRGFGLPDKDENGDSVMRFTKAPWLPGPADPEHGILLLDEFRQAQPDVQKPAAELLLNGRVGDSELTDKWMVISCSNREKDRSGVQRELSFITNRRMEIHIEPHLGSWVDWAERSKIAWQAIAFAKARPGVVFRDEVPSTPGPFCTPRSFVAASRLISRLPDNLFIEAVSGLLGEGAAAELVAFLRTADQLPTLDEIVADPASCRLPAEDRPDAQYACMQMLASQITASNAQQVLEYLMRLPAEFQAAGINSMLRSNPKVVATPTVSKWLTENHAVLMEAASV